jgi:SAM-dependent methyltransferase
MADVSGQPGQEEGGTDAASLRAHWESVGGDYTAEWDPPARSKLGDRELDFIVKALKTSAGRTALDVGIGSGRILSQMLARTDDTVFYGLDIAQAMVDSTRERLAGEPRMRDFAVCDIASEPVPFAERFDFISAIRMLKYNANWPEIVGKLADRLEPGGVFVFSMTNRNSLNRIGRPYAVPFDNATKRELEDLCTRTGLRTLEIAGFTKLPHFVYSARSEAVGRVALAVDHGLDRVLGGPALAREIFVAAQRS